MKKIFIPIAGIYFGAVYFAKLMSSQKYSFEYRKRKYRLYPWWMLYHILIISIPMTLIFIKFNLI